MSYLRILCQIQGHKDLRLWFLVRVSLFLTLTVSPVIHFEVVFAPGVKEESKSSLLYVDVQLVQHHLLKRLSFPLGMILAPCGNS